MIEHVREMDDAVGELHKEADTQLFRWHRRHGGDAGDVAERAAFLPVAMIFAVSIDSSVDGFLIGVTCSFNQHAGAFPP